MVQPSRGTKSKAKPHIFFKSEVFFIANKTLLQGFEWYLPNDGYHWNRLRKRARKIKSANIDMIWLPPAYKGSAGKTSVGYDVYDKYDLGEFDQKGSVFTKYGTKEEYLRCIHSLQHNHIQVLTDIVVNHMTGADATEQVQVREYSQENRNEEVGEAREITAWTSFNFPGRNGVYSEDTWDASDFNATDFDAREKRSGIFQFEGKSWNGKVDWEKGNFDYLMGANLDTTNPQTARKVLEWAKWYLDTTGADGLRLDAVKHISHDFIPYLLKEMRVHAGRDFFAVGEYWSGELERLLNYLDEINDSCSLFDVPLHYALWNASCSNGQYDMRLLMADSLLKARPEQAVTFVDNHDTQPGQALQSFIQPWFKQQAYAMILFQQQGLPCVFYGDLFGIPHDNLPAVPMLEEMCRARYRCAYGAQRDYFSDPHVVGFTRKGRSDNKYSGMAVLITNAQGGSKRMYVNARFRGQEFVDLLHPENAPVTLDEHGIGDFYVGDGSAAVWIRRGAYEYLMR